MAPCSYCKRHNLSCKLSDQDSSRCLSCIQNNQANCDVRGLSPEQLQRVAAQRRNLELELEVAEEKADRVISEANARLRRFRTQKKMRYDKMMKAVSRGIDNLEELDRLERKEEEWGREERGREERAAAVATVATLAQATDSVELSVFEDIDLSWSYKYDEDRDLSWQSHDAFVLR
ncbi:hypothetical protein DL769_002740 [Monosporascus sp. CRB-8-3]|nr:hypothetical protein DL769_002740 [Monosporascus sp. CRB-8-3]